MFSLAFSGYRVVVLMLAENESQYAGLQGIGLLSFFGSFQLVYQLVNGNDLFVELDLPSAMHGFTIVFTRVTEVKACAQVKTSFIRTPFQRNVKSEFTRVFQNVA